MAEAALVARAQGVLLGRTLCGGCLCVVIRAVVGGELVVADYVEWLPRGECLSCAHTRHAHKGVTINCRRCDGTAVVGAPRPSGRLLGISIGEDGQLRPRIVEP